MPRPKSRAADTRAAGARLTHRAYQPNSVLAAPKLKASGKRFRWVRETVQGHVDQTSIGTAIRAGFRPILIEDLADDCPFKITAELTQRDAADGRLRYGGLLGMVLDEGLEEHRQAIIQEQVDAATDGARAVFDMQQQVNGGRGGLPGEFRDLGSSVGIGEPTAATLRPGAS